MDYLFDEIIKLLIEMKSITEESLLVKFIRKNLFNHFKDIFNFEENELMLITNSRAYSYYNFNNDDMAHLIFVKIVNKIESKYNLDISFDEHDSFKLIIFYSIYLSELIKYEPNSENKKILLKNKLIFDLFVDLRTNKKINTRKFQPLMHNNGINGIIDYKYTKETDIIKNIFINFLYDKYLLPYYKSYMDGLKQTLFSQYAGKIPDQYIKIYPDSYFFQDKGYYHAMHVN